VTAELIESVRSKGADLLPFGEHLRVYHPERLEPALIEQLRQKKAAILRALRVERRAIAIVTQHFLREGRFPSEPAPCVYHCGHPHERCRRCGAPLVEHCDGGGKGFNFCGAAGNEGNGAEKKPLNGKTRGRKPTKN
jgi:hypothetical protein